MGRDLQKRKRRSSRPAIKQHTSNKPKRLLNPRGNDIIAKNWDKKQTTTQNYRRLGLVGRLKAPTGGAEPDMKEKKKKVAKTATATKPADPFAIAPASESVVSEVRVERDAAGRIVRILDAGSSSSRSSRRPNPLNDPLNALDSGSEEEEEEEEEGAEEWGGIDEDEEDEDEDEGRKIVRQLEAQASRSLEKKPRTQSRREREWLERLVRKHGGDVRAMAWDRVLNPMQQTEADIARRIGKWKAKGA